MKRKREATAVLQPELPNGKSPKFAKTDGQPHDRISSHVLQIVTGSYERVLHGLTATISTSGENDTPSVSFADTFLFNAHASSVRCLALSPMSEPSMTDSQHVLLASGGTDEKINFYSLSASPPIENQKMPSVPSLSGNKVTENPQNRELGSLLHHSSCVTSLYFPTRSKLLSASEDNTIAISRTKDLSVISTVKAPQPKALGQPSGDTAPQGVVPAGVNDFAVHPSMKLMVSVGKGERCMRLWNLVTGRKAGVLNFEREVLQSVKEGRYSHGEGHRIKWSPDGTEFAVAFERGVVVFGEDSKPKYRVLPQPLTKVHQICYSRFESHSNDLHDVLAVSTEDGRIVFYSTTKLVQQADGKADDSTSIREATIVAQLGGLDAGLHGRIKDFEIVPLFDARGLVASAFIVTASSDGAVRIWNVETQQLTQHTTAKAEVQVGKLIGTYETGSRITCLRAFMMLPPQDEGLSEFDGMTTDGEDIPSGEESADDQ